MKSLFIMGGPWHGHEYDLDNMPEFIDVPVRRGDQRWFARYEAKYANIYYGVILYCCIWWKDQHIGEPKMRTYVATNE